MTLEAIGDALLDIFEGVDKDHFVAFQKDFIIEYVAKNANKGLDYDLGQYLPVMMLFWYLLEDIGKDEKKHLKQKRKFKAK